jgi:aspartate/glutamate racemase
MDALRAQMQGQIQSLQDSLTKLQQQLAEISGAITIPSLNTKHRIMATISSACLIHLIGIIHSIFRVLKGRNFFRTDSTS